MVNSLTRCPIPSGTPLNSDDDDDDDDDDEDDDDEGANPDSGAVAAGYDTDGNEGPTVGADG